MFRLTLLFLISSWVISCTQGGGKADEVMPAERRIDLAGCNAQNGTNYAQQSFDFVKTSYYLNDNSNKVYAPLALASNVPETYLPFSQGDSFLVTQGYGGSFSHNESYGYYSLDFDMPLCSEVVAVAAGRVVEVKENSARGGDTASYINSANYVIIDHGQGAYGRYVHFCKNCVLVAPGDLVNKGQLIGLSGHTGWSTIPHLHFQMNEWETSESYSKRFEDVVGVEVDGVPVEGNTYTSGNSETVGSGAAFSGQESNIPMTYFIDNGVTMTQTFRWYAGLKKGQAKTIQGEVSNSNTDQYVQVFIYSSQGSSIEGASAQKSGNTFTVTYTPSVNLEGNWYKFAITTKEDANSKYRPSVGFLVYIED